MVPPHRMAVSLCGPHGRGPPLYHGLFREFWFCQSCLRDNQALTRYDRLSCSLISSAVSLPLPAGCLFGPSHVPTYHHPYPPVQQDEQQITALSYLSVYPDVADIQFNLQPSDTFSPCTPLSLPSSSLPLAYAVGTCGMELTMMAQRLHQPHRPLQQAQSSESPSLLSLAPPTNNVPSSSYRR